MEQRDTPIVEKRAVIDAICLSASWDAESGLSLFSSKNIDQGPSI